MTFSETEFYEKNQEKCVNKFITFEVVLPSPNSKNQSGETTDKYILFEWY